MLYTNLGSLNFGLDAFLKKMKNIFISDRGQIRRSLMSLIKRAFPTENLLNL